METLGKAFDMILLGDQDLHAIVFLSLRVSLTATILVSLLAIPLGCVIANRSFIGRRVLLVIASAFMALPPVVVGLAVYLLLSHAGPLGSWGLLFTPNAMIIAQSILIFPIILILTIEAIRPLQQDYCRFFNVLDTSFLVRLLTLIIDARFAIFMAILAGFGRALAEVGAVLIVGGNINGVTRVMTTTIALETSKGNLNLALALGIILITIAIFINALIHILARIGRKYER